MKPVRRLNFRAQVLAMIQAAEGAGCSTAEIMRTMESDAHSVRKATSKLFLAGRVFRAGPPKRVRYYASADHAWAADPVLRAEQAEISREGRRRSDANWRAKKAPKVEKPKRSPAQQAHTLAVQRQASEASPWRKDTTMPPRMKRRDLPVVIPDGVKVTRAATPVDYRFHVDPTHRGEFAAAGIGRYLETV